MGALLVASASGRQDALSAPIVYEVSIAKDGAAEPLRTEWVSLSTGEWRFEEDGRTKIYSRNRYAVVDPVQGTYVRNGSSETLGYLKIAAVSLEPLRTHLGGADAAAGSGRTTDLRVSRSASGQTVLRFRRDGVPLQAVLLRQLPLEEPDVRSLFAIDDETASATMEERPVGSRPQLALRPYWFGQRFANRTARTTVEYARRVPPSVAARGQNSERLETRIYVTMYELPKAGSRSSAVPGQLPPEGEIQVVSQPLSLASSRAALLALSGRNGDQRYPPWPRTTVSLANGERATVIPNLSEGLRRTPSGRQEVFQFAVITAETLTWVSGGFDLREIDDVARTLRPVTD